MARLRTTSGVFAMGDGKAGVYQAKEAASVPEAKDSSGDTVERNFRWLHWGRRTTKSVDGSACGNGSRKSSLPLETELINVTIRHNGPL
jgi:hypothetical protein